MAWYDSLTPYLPTVVIGGAGLIVLWLGWYFTMMFWEKRKAKKQKLDINLLEQHIEQANEKLREVHRTLVEFNVFVQDLKDTREVS